MNPTQDSARSWNKSRVHDTLRSLVRHFDINCHWCIVYGLGIAWSRPVNLMSGECVIYRSVSVKVYIVVLLICFEIPLPNASLSHGDGSATPPTL